MPRKTHPVLRECHLSGIVKKPMVDRDLDAASKPKALSTRSNRGSTRTCRGYPKSRPLSPLFGNSNDRPEQWRGLRRT